MRSEACSVGWAQVLSLVTAVVKPHKLHGGEGRPERGGRARAHHQRGQGLRSPGRAHRDLPRRRVLHRLRAEGQGRGAWSPPRTRRRSRRSSAASRRPARIGDGKIWVTPVRAGRCGSAPASGATRRRPAPSQVVSSASSPSRPIDVRTAAVQQLLVGRSGSDQPHDADEVTVADQDQVPFLDRAVGELRLDLQRDACRPTARRSRGPRSAG